MSSNPSISDWATLLLKIAEPIAQPVLPTSDRALADFRDEYGHRRAADEPLIRHLCDRMQFSTSARPPQLKEADAALWWMTHADQPDPWPWIEAGNEALTHRSKDAQIEIWTETELSALHAAWTIAERIQDDKLVERCLVAAEWHTRELQPDNGTNHPWAIHVFLKLWNRSGQAEARLHAETMLHNCTVQQGQPDTFSAIILLHAAQSLASGLD